MKCPDDQGSDQSAAPDAIPGPPQHDAGLKVFANNLLIAHAALRGVITLVQAISHLRLAKIVRLGYVQRLHDALR